MCASESIICRRTSHQSTALEAWIKDASSGGRDDVNATKPKVREDEVVQHQLSNRLDRIEGDVHRCVDCLRPLNGPGLGVGNPGAHPKSQPEPVKVQCVSGLWSLL